MKCEIHHDIDATSFCSNCGTPLCLECRITTESGILCPKCRQSLPEPNQHGGDSSPKVSKNTFTDPQVVRDLNPIPPLITQKGSPYCSPGVSLALGFIPGVGAICNGEYWKAFLQVLFFGSLISLGGRTGREDAIPIFRLLAVLMYIYMPLEAYHAARKRVMALQGVTFATPLEKMHFSSLAVGITAVCLGVIFQVNQLAPETMRFLLRGWPLILVALGLYNLARHFRTQ